MIFLHILNRYLSGIEISVAIKILNNSNFFLRAKKFFLIKNKKLKVFNKSYHLYIDYLIKKKVLLQENSEFFFEEFEEFEIC